MTEDSPYAEISMLVHKYADAVVHRNGAQWSSTWHEDAVWDLGGGRLVEGIDAIKNLWYGAMKGFQATIQTVLNGGIEVDPSGMKASGRWYIQEQVVRTNGDRGILLAHYETNMSRQITVGNLVVDFCNLIMQGHMIYLKSFNVQQINCANVI